jgi:ubiquinone/menaquinone biosynthesis C-methylase UbiE
MAEKLPVFAGSIPENYQRYLVPIIFEDYASDLAERVNAPAGAAVLELACGTGVVTRHLRSSLPDTVHLVATDLNPGMLEAAQSTLGGATGVEFQVADATDLPFEDASFDAVVCQFGVMFFPDKSRGFAEAERVLKPGGQLHISVWDSLERNSLSKLAHETMLSLSADDPIMFMALPFSYHDAGEIEETLKAAGFADITFEVQARESRADSANDVVMGLIAGSPLAAELEERSLTDQGRAAIESALISNYGDGEISAPMQAIIFSASKST